MKNSADKSCSCQLVLSQSKNLSAALFFALLIVHGSVAFGQRETIRQYNAMIDRWSYGTIQVDNKTKLTGRLRYNSFENILTIEIEDKTRTFGPQGIQRFDIESSEGTRHFISSPDKETTIENPTRYFFEILSECDHFALLSKRISNAYRQSSASANFNDTPMVTVVTEEMLYFFDDRGSIEPYLMITETNSSALLFNEKVRRKVINKKLIKRYVSDRYDKVKSYAKENHLSFKRKDGLIRILNFYHKLEKEE